LAGKRQGFRGPPGTGAETRFRPGQSGNPKGPKPGLNHLRELLEAAMQKRDRGKPGTRLERMVISLARKLADSDQAAVEFVGKRVWPAPLQVDLSGDLTLNAERDALDTRLARGFAAVAPRSNGHDPASDIPRGAATGREGGGA